MLDVFVSVNEFEIALLDVLLGPIEFLQLSLVLSFVLILQFQVFIIEQNFIVL
jgi:hypothetical protein